MIRLTRHSIVLASILCMFLALACGSSSGGSSTPSGTVGETATATIAAATGGTVALPSGVASIKIPAGALAADTPISITTLTTEGAPSSASLGSYIFEFGPTGTTFSSPVTITLDSVDVPSGKKANLAWLGTDNTWQVVSGSALANGAVSGSVSHFTKFVVYFTDEGGTVVTDDSACKDLSFTACGGDVTGTWQVQTYCLQTRSFKGTNPFAQVAGCEKTTVALDYEQTGSVTLNADGTFTSAFGYSTSVEMGFSDDCLAALRKQGGSEASGLSNSETCTKLAESFNKSSSDAASATATATGSYKDGICTISQLQNSENPQTTTGTYTTASNTLTLTNATHSEAYPYCVKDNQIVIERTSVEDDNQDGTSETYTDHMILKK